MIEEYDNLQWEISEFPVASSTPDEFYELDYNAVAVCPECGSNIDGVAHYWSRDSDMVHSWLERIDYEPCEQCEHDENVYEDDDDDEQENNIIDDITKNL